ncbi:hypothetical protein CDD81_6819 [Ophiocordyceps australis]|uniref:Galactosyl transferase GMA12/MNN10 family protein n=1 Tax=Ophiocordyceps australis TaxID=1399860 RepID=A0A2C5Y4V5_9HYPO|nr:hypothetical protein CDD81_6819 [Ophiocordyceps australis]
MLKTACFPPQLRQRRVASLLVVASFISLLLHFTLYRESWRHRAHQVLGLSGFKAPAPKQSHDASESEKPLGIGQTYEGSRIGKVTMLYGPSRPVYERALRTHKVHNQIHGYHMVVQRHEMLPGFWTKPSIILSVILNELSKAPNDRLEWLFWIDADSVIINYNTPLDIFLPPSHVEELAHINILVTKDWNGLNNGIFGLRVGPYAAELFASIVAYSHYKPDTPLIFHDQSAMEEVLKMTKFGKHSATLPQRWFNAYTTGIENMPVESEVQAGDLLVHFAGVGNRESVMAHWCDVSEKREAKWLSHASENGLLEQVRTFWDRYKTDLVQNKENWVQGKMKLQEAIGKAQDALTSRAGAAADSEALRKALQAARDLNATVYTIGPDDVGDTERDKLSTVLKEVEKASKPPNAA